MATPLDESQFEVVEQPPAAGPTPLDESLIESLPSYADGTSELSPVNKSPVSIADRAALSMGNPVGNLNYLKKTYEDARATPDGDLVVKDKGIWHRVDAKGLGETDAWETTKKIAKTLLIPPHVQAFARAIGKDIGTVTPNDLPEMAGDAADLAGGAVVAGASIGGAFAGMGAGSVATAAAGGAAGEGMRTSLGRLAGTYEASPMQQVKDIGWEGLLAAGGQTVALGAKPTFEVLKSALKPYATSATNYSKEVMSSLWGDMTTAGRWSVRRAMDKPEAVINKAQAAVNALPAGTSPMEAVGVAVDKQIGIVKTFAKEGDQALSNLYQRDSAAFVKEIGDDFTVNVGNGVKAVQQELVDAGYGMVTNGKLKVFTPAQHSFNTGVPVDQLPKVMGANTQAAMEEIANLTNQYGQLGEFKGKGGAKRLLDIKRAMNETFSDLLSGDTPDSIRRVVTKIKSSMDDKVGQAFANHNDKAFEAYSTMNTNYSTRVDAVRMLKDAVKGGDIESVVKKLVSKSGSNRSLKDESKVVADLLGERGHALTQDLLDWEAAKGFVDFVPKHLSGSSVGTLTKGIGMITQQSNPRAVSAQIAYGNHALDFLKGVGRNTSKFLANDKAVTSFAQPLVEAYGGEESEVENVLRGAGVK